ncbi:Metallo-dependent hydrolase [Basidiobolus meristosporus CBS 931.73]|uniref:N-acetylglucosamine-6-phosphate deacetylase n=1 Tax=Basidiobolus meristosporus CBS 931.73 TaxID=1314790 RepID=A0A1Y1YEH1_9FUNG|nr:Metallo-dependent hydrolase [Basidiobolus meristosporus CBS 931.73]|eukprot:ORX96368.1 Metallo-dependent hydrolase [Basidiobolus meristosporus CBS 931.73]
MEKQARITKIVNARAIRAGQIIVGEDFYVQEGKFVNPKSVYLEDPSQPVDVIDAKNALMSPGYIDVQVNGGLGIDFTSVRSNISQGLDKVAKFLLKCGCTSFCPTVVSSNSEFYTETLSQYAPRPGSIHHGAEVLGLHLEGPFISPQRLGAHDKTTVRQAPNGIEDFKQCYNLNAKNTQYISLITVAPEVEGVLDTIPHLVKENFVVSVGHSDATNAQAEKAIENGATMVTHMFNAMRPFHHRDPGIIGLLAGESKPRPYYGIICDGVHCHPSAVKLAHYSHPKGAVLVSDCASVTGLPPGQYTHGTNHILVDKTEERVFVAGTETLAGSVMTIDKCVKNYRQFTGCSIVEAIEAATLHPAQVLNITAAKGSLEVGVDADFLFLDDELNVMRVFVGGEEVDIQA